MIFQMDVCGIESDASEKLPSLFWSQRCTYLPERELNKQLTVHCGYKTNDSA